MKPALKNFICMAMIATIAGLATIAPAGAADSIGSSSGMTAQTSQNAKAQSLQEEVILRDKIMQIIKDGDVRDVSYIEKMFNVHFSDPTYTKHPHSMLSSDADIVDIQQKAVSKRNLPTDFPGYVLKYITYVRGLESSLSPPYGKPLRVILYVSGNQSANNCFKVDNFRSLFDAPPTGPVGMRTAAVYTFRKLSGSQMITLDIDQGLGVCARYVKIDFDYNPTTQSNQQGAPSSKTAEPIGAGQPSDQAAAMSPQNMNVGFVTYPVPAENNLAREAEAAAKDAQALQEKMSGKPTVAPSAEQIAKQNAALQETVLQIMEEKFNEDPPMAGPAATAERTSNQATASTKRPVSPSPETAKLLAKIGQLIKSGDVRDTSYLEKLFNVHFSAPTYNKGSHPTVNGVPDSVDVNQDAVSSEINPKYHSPYLHLMLRNYVRGEKDPLSPPYKKSFHTTLDIIVADDRVCLEVSDFQPFFGKPPTESPLMVGGKSYKYTKSSKSQVTALNITPAGTNCDVDIVSINVEYNQAVQPK